MRKWGQIYLFGGVKRSGSEASAVSQDGLLGRLSYKVYINLVPRRGLYKHI